MNQDDIYYQAMLARDYRFDGKFFVGVKTTGIYCRPICPARPLRKNVEFFSDIHTAEKKGYRPCLRCRPESSPQSAAWNGRSATVQRALRIIAKNNFLELNENEFADQLGVSARHLRRLFDLEIGKTPKQISDIQRLNFARKLVTETSLPITDIAFSSGFSSIRRFNEAFKTRFHRSPSDQRKALTQGASVEGCDGQKISLMLSYRPPLDWERLLAHYQVHQLHGLETIENGKYHRVFSLEGQVGALTLYPTESNKKKSNQLRLEIYFSETKLLYKIVQRVRQMFDLDSDPILISNAFEFAPPLQKLNKKCPGLRIARGWDAFETSICTILGQLVSISHANQLVRKLIETYGESIQDPRTQKKLFLFPTPQTLAKADFTSLGTTQKRKETLREFSRRVQKNEIDLSSIQDSDQFKEHLCAIPGIGAWTAEYICLRALGETDAFPGTDLILKRATDQHPELELEKVRPWRSYAAIYLWSAYASQQRVKSKPFKNLKKFKCASTAKGVTS